MACFTTKRKRDTKKLKDGTSKNKTTERKNHGITSIDLYYESTRL